MLESEFPFLCYLVMRSCVWHCGGDSFLPLFKIISCQNCRLFSVGREEKKRTIRKKLKGDIYKNSRKMSKLVRQNKEKQGGGLENLMRFHFFCTFNILFGTSNFIRHIDNKRPNLGNKTRFL